LSNFYNLTYHHESFNFAGKQYNELRVKYNLRRKTIQLSDVIQHQKKYLTDTLKDLDNQGDYVTKLFPRDLIFTTYGTSIKDGRVFEHEIYSNFNELFQLENFDKVYFLDRNIIESTASFGYAYSIDMFLFTEKGHLDYKKKKNQKIEISNLAFSFMNYHIYESLLHGKIKNFLDRKNITYTALDYHNCENYIEQNLKCDEPNLYFESNFDYKNLILNYNQCVEHIETKIEEYSTLLKNVEFI
jgi:hypothetical protein